MDGTLLGFVGVALLVMQPAELLKHLCVRGRVVEDTLVRGLGAVELYACQW